MPPSTNSGTYSEGTQWSRTFGATASYQMPSSFPTIASFSTLTTSDVWSPFVRQWEAKSHNELSRDCHSWSRGQSKVPEYSADCLRRGRVRHMAKDQNNVDPFFESLKFAIASVTRDDARQALSKTQKLSKLSSHPQTRLMGLISESVQNLPLPIKVDQGLCVLMALSVRTRSYGTLATVLAFEFGSLQSHCVQHHNRPAVRSN